LIKGYIYNRYNKRGGNLKSIPLRLKTFELLIKFYNGQKATVCTAQSLRLMSVVVSNQK